MQIILILIGLAILGAIAFLVYRLKNLGKTKNTDPALEMMQRLMENTKTDNERIVRDSRESSQKTLEMINSVRQEMHQNLNQTNSNLQTQLSQTNKAINERLDNAAKVIGVVSKHLGGMQEIGRQMKDFQDFLRSPKLRGNLGEQILRDLLEQMLPKNCYSLQYKFQEGQTVDAIVKNKNTIIPIDSKFPMENFQKISAAGSEDEKKSLRREFMRDVRKHIDSISKKYILPQEGTVDFAVMYVPNERIWYEVVMDDDNINEYAQGKKVHLVSPNSFYYFLKVVMVGLEGAKIEEAAKEILATLKGIKQDADKFGGALGVLSKHVNNAKNMMDNVNNEYTKLSVKIDRVEMLEAPDQNLKSSAQGGSASGGKNENLKSGTQNAKLFEK